MDELENNLENQKHRFDAAFEDAVMNKVLAQKNEPNKLIISLQRYITLAACVIVTIFAWQLYAMDGELSYDSMLGLGNSSSIEVQSTANIYYEYLNN
ncbi:MAG: hypothetical protein ACI8ZN_002465 [Bacteroidia bacterium]|jgi:hypothetical protein